MAEEMNTVFRMRTIVFTSQMLGSEKHEEWFKSDSNEECSDSWLSEGERNGHAGSSQL